MGWYKLQAIYGPGHQSGRTVYKWLPDNLSPEEKQDVFSSVFEGENDPIGSIRKVAKIPKLIRDNMIAGYKTEIDVAQYMLKILKKAKTLK